MGTVAYRRFAFSLCLAYGLTGFLGLSMLSAQVLPDVPAESPQLLPEDIVPSKPPTGETTPGAQPPMFGPGGGRQGCRSEQRISELDGLFYQLKRVTDTAVASRLAQQIQGVWARTDSDTLDLLMQWAESAIKARDYAQAVDFLDNIIALAPECAESRMRRASIHIERNDLALALLDLNEVLQQEPRHYNAMMQLGLVMEMLDKPQQAIKLYEKALEIYPQFGRLQKRLGHLLEETSDSSV